MCIVRRYQTYEIEEHTVEKLTYLWKTNGSNIDQAKHPVNIAKSKLIYIIRKYKGSVIQLKGLNYSDKFKKRSLEILYITNIIF